MMWKILDLCHNYPRTPGVVSEMFLFYFLMWSPLVRKHLSDHPLWSLFSVIFQHKKIEKAYINQHLECAAPKRLSKYTTNTHSYQIRLCIETFFWQFFLIYDAIHALGISEIGKSAFSKIQRKNPLTYFYGGGVSLKWCFFKLSSKNKYDKNVLTWLVSNT